MRGMEREVEGTLMNHDRRKLMAVFGLCLTTALPAAAQSDIEDARDYPGLSRPAGYYINSFDDSASGGFGFRVAGDNYKQVTGRTLRIQYALKEGARNPGPDGVGHSYAGAIQAMGGAMLAEHLGSVGGSVSASWKADGRLHWIQVDIGGGGSTFTVNIVEEDTMKANVETLADQLERTIREKGSIAIYGIEFDTGTTVIRPESAAVLAAIAEMLGANEDLRIEIQGHTANVGDRSANVTLSRQRAAAVRDDLVSIYQVTASQLSIAGLGDSKPVSTNATDEGRTLNRRIVLVKKS